MIKRVAMVFGIVFLLVGLLGLVTSGGTSMSVEDPAMLLGLFPVNLLHNVVHLAFGGWGIAAARSYGGARSYAMIGGGIYLALAVLGFIVPNGFGLVPIGGNDIWLHALLGAALLGAGLTAKEEAGGGAAPVTPA